MNHRQHKTTCYHWTAQAPADHCQFYVSIMVFPHDLCSILSLRVLAYCAGPEKVDFSAKDNSNNSDIEIY